MSISSSFSPIYLKSSCTPSPATVTYSPVTGALSTRATVVASPTGRNTLGKEVVRAEELVSKFAKYTQEEELTTRAGEIAANKLDQMMSKFKLYTLEEEMSVTERNAYNTSPRMRGSCQ